MTEPTNLFRPASPRRVRAGLGVSLSLAILLGAGVATASPQNASLIQSHLGLSCEPTCMICHNVDPGLGGTADKDFVLTMLDSGMRLGNDASIATALDAIQASGADTDSNGTSDYDALMALQDPNGTLGMLGGAPICEAGVAGPKYGCGAAHVAPGASGGPGSPVLPWGLGAGALALALFWRRRALLR